MLSIRIIKLILLYKLAQVAGETIALDGELAGEQDTLRQVLLVHRHGDRTPISLPEGDPLRNDPLWQLYGLGQLTNEGKQRVYELGQLMRERYDRFMGRSVDKSRRFSRTSQTERCVESAQLFLASFLALDRPEEVDGEALMWNRTLSLGRQWQPASVASVPVKFDGMLAASARCRSLDVERDLVERSKAARQAFDEFAKEISILERAYGVKITNWEQLTNTIDTALIEARYLPSKVSGQILAIRARLSEANNLGFGFVQASVKLRRLRAGLLMGELVANMRAAREASSSPQTRRFLHYSTHDTTLAVLLGMLGAWRNRQPDFASNLTFELHQRHSEWFVRVLYMSPVPSEPSELKVAGCQRDQCSLDEFGRLMEPYLFAAGWQQWMAECDNRLEELEPYERT